jgi:hypothetical protein
VPVAIPDSWPPPRSGPAAQGRASRDHRGPSGHPTPTEARTPPESHPAPERGPRIRRLSQDDQTTGKRRHPGYHGTPMTDRGPRPALGSLEPDRQPPSASPPTPRTRHFVRRRPARRTPSRAIQEQGSSPAHRPRHPDQGRAPGERGGRLCASSLEQTPGHARCVPRPARVPTGRDADPPPGPRSVPPGGLEQAPRAGSVPGGRDDDVAGGVLALRTSDDPINLVHGVVDNLAVRRRHRLERPLGAG